MGPGLSDLRTQALFSSSSLAVEKKGGYSAGRLHVGSLSSERILPTMLLIGAFKAGNPASGPQGMRNSVWGQGGTPAYMLVETSQRHGTRPVQKGAASSTVRTPGLVSQPAARGLGSVACARSLQLPLLRSTLCVWTPAPLSGSSECPVRRQLHFFLPLARGKSRQVGGPRGPLWEQRKWWGMLSRSFWKAGHLTCHMF